MRSQQSCGWTRCSTDAQTRQARLEAEQVRAEDDSLANTRFLFKPAASQEAEQEKGGGGKEKRERSVGSCRCPGDVLVLRYERMRQ